MTVEQVAEVQNKIGKLNLLVLDEVSMISVHQLLTLNDILKQVYSDEEARKDLPFGGVNVILVGDFFQLPPVNAIGLAQNLVERECTRISKAGKEDKKEESAQQQNKDVLLTISSKYQCAKLLKSFKKVELLQQQRRTPSTTNSSSSETPPMTVVERFRELTTLGRRVISRDMINGIRNLDPEKDSKNRKWNIAPIIVSTNRERQLTNMQRIKAYAKIIGKPVIRWRLPLKIPKEGKTVAVESNTELIYQENIEPYMYFVPYAPCLLTHNFNVEEGYANGTTVFLHSIMYSVAMSPKDIDDFQDHLTNTAAGEIVDLAHVPQVIYCFKAEDNEHPFYRGSEKEDIKTLWKSFGQNRDTELFPIKTTERGATSRTSELKANLYVDKSERKKMEYVNYGIELKLSLTYHKIQGMTAPCLILQLNKSPETTRRMLNFFCLYVALTRTRTDEDLRKIPMMSQDYSHLQNLTCKPWLHVYMRMYDTHSGMWKENPKVLQKPKADFTTGDKKGYWVRSVREQISFTDRCTKDRDSDIFRKQQQNSEDA
eukprot:gene8075-8731_t